MRFVSSILQQFQSRTRTMQHNRFSIVGKNNFFQSFGKSNQRQIFIMPEFPQNLHRRIHLTFTTIANPQIGHGRSLFFQPSNSPRHHFSHTGKIIDSRNGFDDKLAVIFFVGATIFKRDQAGNGMRSRQMGNIYPFNAERRS